MLAYISTGGSTAHTGFLSAYVVDSSTRYELCKSWIPISWNSVASSVISTVRAQVAAHPGYQLVSTGHSLGGALNPVYMPRPF
jgi:hypothetical protein